MGQYLGFNPAKLVPVKVETWGPFVFVNLDTEARPLVEQFEGLTDKIGLRLHSYRLIGRHDVEPASNWKVVGKNFLKNPMDRRREILSTRPAAGRGNRPRTQRPATGYMKPTSQTRSRP